VTWRMNNAVARQIRSNYPRHLGADCISVGLSVSVGQHGLGRQAGGPVAFAGVCVVLV